MNIYYRDENNQEILLSSNKQQVMMEWERPYMEASIDMLQPKGDVLEIGFGCGYSATQIMKYPIESYTVIECDPGVIEKEMLSGAIAGEYDINGNVENPEIADVLYTKSVVAGLFRLMNIEVSFVRSKEKATYFHPLKQLDIMLGQQKIGITGFGE